MPVKGGRKARFTEKTGAANTLVLKEIEEAGSETGRYLVRQVDYIYRGEFCLPGYCVMSISAL